jgi:hypothetical protein
MLRQRSTKKWRVSATRLLVFLGVLALEASFNIGILLGRLRWKNDMNWIQPVFFLMAATLLLLLWALYRQTRHILHEYIQDASE